MYKIYSNDKIFTTVANLDQVKEIKKNLGKMVKITFKKIKR